MKNCALYVRVSSQRQANVEDGSLDAQEARLKSYIQYEQVNKKDNWNIVDLYREEGKSAKNLIRPEFQRMMDDIKAGKINTIIVWKIDRLTRSLKDFTILWDFFQEKGIQLISLNEKFDTSSAIGKAMLQIILVFAQLEREQTSERTVATMQYRAEIGLYNGGRLVGYDRDPENKGILKVNTEQQDLVNRAFDICLEKGSAGEVQKVLNELGYRMPVYESRTGKKHGGTRFNKQMIIRMLSNPTYIGKISWNGQLYEGKHNPIVEKEKFEKVQKILNKNRITRKNEKAIKDYVYLLQGVVRCGKCGSFMTPKSGKNGSGKAYHYYQCSKNIHEGKSGCKAKYVPAKSVDDFVLERVKELSTNKSEIDKMIEKAGTFNKQKLENLVADKEILSKHLISVKAKLEKLIDLVESGDVGSFKTIKERLQKLELDRNSSEQKIMELEFEMMKEEEKALSAQVICQSFGSLKEVIEGSDPLKLKQLLGRIIDKVEFFEPESDTEEGRLKIAYYEHPNLKFALEKTGEQLESELFARCNDQLPD